MLSRKKDEGIVIGDSIVVSVVEIRGDKVRVGIDAPREVSVHREEVWLQLQRPKQPPADSPPKPATPTVPDSKGPLSPIAAPERSLEEKGRVQTFGPRTATAVARPPEWHAPSAVEKPPTGPPSLTARIGHALRSAATLPLQLLASILHGLASVIERTGDAYDRATKRAERATAARKVQRTPQRTPMELTAERLEQMVGTLGRTASDLRETHERFGRVHEQLVALVETCGAHARAAADTLARFEQISTPPPETASHAKSPARKKRRKR